MKNQKGFIQIPILTAIIVGILFLGGSGYFGIREYQNYQAEKLKEEKEAKIILEAQQKTLEQAQKEIDELKAESKQSKNQQMTLEQARLEIEKLKEENSKAQEKQSALEKQVQVTKQAQEKTKQSLPSEEDKLSKAEIIKSWQNSVLKISCLMTDAYTNDSFMQSGSGSGFKLSDGRIFFFTNKHVIVNDEGYSIEKCSVSAPNLGNFEISLPSVKLHNKFDFSYMVSDESGKNFAMSYNLNFCPAGTAQLGDEVLILGYPVTGSQSSITVTDGIISGFEENYFVTSAKIEQGNSGGAAILVKQNCFLGLPTAAVVGIVESLGRILKIERIINYEALKR